MSKRKISNQQQKRIKKHQQKRITQLEKTTSETNQEQEGLIVAHYGAYVDVENSEGLTFRCNLRQNLGAAVAGDRVVWKPASSETGILLAILPRKSLLARSGSRGIIKPIAANIDQVAVVFAPLPRIAASIIDSYLVAIHTLGLSAILLCNKMDLLDPQKDQDFFDQISTYQHIGYTVLLVSANTGEGIADLTKALHDQTVIFVGQSGVGKSSLISKLIPEFTVDNTIAGTHGTHTTTTARLYHLASGGNLIDSPGIREFSLGELAPAELAHGFIEFKPYLGSCKFRNCLHLDEPGCAILGAIENKFIPRSRYESYRRILATLKNYGS